jgi:hypothetical protein
VSLYPLLGTAVPALAAGFAAGMTTYQKSRRWCRRCGITLTCDLCQPAGRTGVVAR